MCVCVCVCVYIYREREREREREGKENEGKREGEIGRELGVAVDMVFIIFLSLSSNKHL